MIEGNTQSQAGFNLIEAGIVLGIVGLVIGGIWVAAAKINEDRIANRIAEATLHYYQSASAAIRNSRDISWSTASVAIEAGFIPRDIIVSESPPMFALGPVTLACCNQSSVTAGPQYNGIGFTFIMPLNKSALCRKVLMQVVNHSWRQVVMITGGANMFNHPFGGVPSSQPTLLTGPISPSDPGLSICETSYSGLPISYFIVNWGIYR